MTFPHTLASQSVSKNSHRCLAADEDNWTANELGTSTCGKRAAREDQTENCPYHACTNMLTQKPKCERPPKISLNTSQIVTSHRQRRKPRFCEVDTAQQQVHLFVEGNNYENVRQTRTTQQRTCKMRLGRSEHLRLVHLRDSNLCKLLVSFPP